MGILMHVTMLQKYKKILECTQLSKISAKFLLGQCLSSVYPEIHKDLSYK